MSSLHLLPLLLAVWITMVAGDPIRAERIAREVRPALSTSGTNFLAEASVGHVLMHAPERARLINSVPALPALKDRLIDNYTLIIENAVDTFRCGDKNYGYYADVDNNCQIFHVCVPLRQLYPANFTQDITFQFSFICNKHTIFSQDSMTCAWEEEALPCEYAPELYWMNNNFFRKIITPTGERYAEVNEPFP